MTPLIPETLSRQELLAIYRSPTGSAVSFGLETDDEEGWERVRKYAYARYWAQRLTDPDEITEAELEEWQAYIGLPFLANVACGVIGDAARRNRLSRAMIRLLSSLPGLNAFAHKQLAARELLLDRRPDGSSVPAIDDACVDALIDFQTPWALFELLRGPLAPNGLAAIVAHADDPRLTRRDRHELARIVRLRKRSPDGSAV